MPPSVALPRMRLLGVVVAVVVALFIFSLIAIVLLVFATQQQSVFLGRWLALLLNVTSYLPWLLGIATLPALVITWRNRGRLARRLITLMVIQFLVACGMGILPLWLVFKAAETNFVTLQDATFNSISNIRNAVLIQSQQQLETVGEQIGQQLWSHIDANSGGLGLLLDDLRTQHLLDQLAIIDDSGRVLAISPASGNLEEFSALVVQRIHRGGSDYWLRNQVEGQLEEVMVVPREAGVVDTIGSPRLALWIEQRLPLTVSDDLREIDSSVAGYLNSKSMQAGINHGLLLVVINSIALLLFVAVNFAVYFGMQLGTRLSDLSNAMKQVADQDVPRKLVDIKGDDEITIVSRSFNALVAKVGALVTRQQALRGDLETIQDVMDSGLFVLDGTNRVLSFNRAAVRLLSINDTMAQPRSNEFLASYTERYPHLVAFAAAINQPGEVNVGKRRLLVRVVSLDERRVVVFTDISEPLAVQKYNAQYEAFQETLHGINNPLQVALLKTELLRDQLDDPADSAKLQQNANQILHQLERIRDQAQWWDRKDDLGDQANKAQDANVIVRACVENTECGSTEIELVLEPDLPLIRAEENLLQDALENLLVNSQQQFEITGQRERHVKISTLHDQSKVVLIFEDNAGGIAAELLPSIFERDVSYKDTGKGIGLARVRESLDKVGATIKASLISEHGTTGLRHTITLRQAAEDLTSR